MESQLAATDQTRLTSPEAPKGTGSVLAQLLIEKKTKILKAQAQATKAMLALCDAVSDVIDTSAISDPATFLRTECLISRSDIGAYRRYKSAVGADRELLQRHNVPFDIIKALVTADGPTREQALRRIQTGVPMEPSTVNRIRCTNTDNARSKEQVLKNERDRRFRDLAKSHGTRAVEAIEDDASHLLEKMYAFAVYYDGAENVGHPVFTNEDLDIAAYERDRDMIIAEAGILLSSFRAIFGDSHPAMEDWALVGLKDSAQRALAEVHHTLAVLSSGQFGNEEDPFPWDTDSFFRWSAVSAIEYLAGTRCADPYHYGAQATRAEKLPAIELCAGAGGEALGLMAAGFHAEALFDNMKNATETLKTNWPSWNVITRNLNTKKAMKDINRILESGRPALVAGGVPCQPYSTLGARKGRIDKRELFKTAQHFVREIKPKAFFFENVKGFLENPHMEWRQELMKEFTALGYHSEIIQLDAQDFGLAQRRKRVAIIGVLQEYKEKLRSPSAKLPPSTLSQAVSDLAFPDRSSAKQLADPVWLANRSKAQQDYDAWAACWIKKHGEKSTPTLTASIGYQSKKRQNKSSQVADWLQHGIDVTDGRTGQVRLGEVTSIDMPIPMTVALAKRLQGFPDEWSFAGRHKRDQLKQIGNALPPVMARAVGIILHNALTDGVTDLMKALTSPLVDPSRIGKREHYSAAIARRYTRYRQALEWKDYILTGDPNDSWDEPPVARSGKLQNPPPKSRAMQSSPSLGSAP